MDDWESDLELERQTAETFRRIHLLRAKGYRIEWEVADGGDAFFLSHLASGPRLILYSSGVLVALGEGVQINPSAEENPTSIPNKAVNDVQIFDRWLVTVPEPTWWEMGAPDREKYIYIPIFWLAILAFAFVLSELIEWAYGLLTN